MLSSAALSISGPAGGALLLSTLGWVWYHARQRALRLQLQEQLRKDQAHLAQTQRMAAVGSWELDWNSGELTRSQQLYRIFEIDEGSCPTPDEAFLELVHPEDRRAVAATRAAALARGEPYAIEHRLLFADGRIKHVLERGETCYEGGRALRSIGTVQEITVGRGGEESGGGDQEFRSLVEHSPDTIARYDVNCRGVYANRMLLRGWSISAAEFLGRTPAEQPGGAPGEMLFARVDEAIATGREDEFEYRGESCGSMGWTQVRLVPERDQAGKVTHVLAIGRDISLLKEAEQVLEESRSRLRRLAAHRDRERERERKQLAWGMHEDLAQLLAVMGWELKMVEQELEPTDPHLAQIAHISILARRALGNIRSTVDAVWPAALELGLVPALEGLVTDIRLGRGIVCRLQADELELSMAEERAIILYRIIEALFEAIGDDPALGCVDLSLSRQGPGILLRLHYGGGERPSVESFGFITAYELTMRLGGEIVVVKSREGTVLVEVTIPHQDRPVASFEGP